MVIGGGIFGIYAALHLAKQGRRGILLEKETRPLSRASLVNQARLHGGYHYPRSVATAKTSHEYQQRFVRDHQDFINTQFTQFYAIDRFGSMTDSAQFRRFSSYVDAPYTEVKIERPFHPRRIAALFKTVEYSFDPLLLGNYYFEQIVQHPSIDLYTQSDIKRVARDGSNWEIDVLLSQQKRIRCRTPLVINATYAASNAIHELFGLNQIDLQYEIAEMVLLSVPACAQQGLTVMDGQYGSLMPYGLSGLHSLSSVAYTHHELSQKPLPTFYCQTQHPGCTPHRPANCNHCPVRPRSNYVKMQRQMQQYFTDTVAFNFYQSLFTIKTKLRANSIDDGRPTEISQLSSSPAFYCIFAGKVQSIYEIEKEVWG